MSNKPFRSVSISLSVDCNDNSLFIALPKTLEEIINPRDLQDLLPRLAKVAPYQSKEGKTIWKVSNVKGIKALYNHPVVVDFHDHHVIRRATRNDLAIHNQSLQDGSDLGTWIDESGRKVFIKEA